MGFPLENGAVRMMALDAAIGEEGEDLFFCVSIVHYFECYKLFTRN